MDVTVPLDPNWLKVAGGDGPLAHQLKLISLHMPLCLATPKARTLWLRFKLMTEIGRRRNIDLWMA